MSKGFSQIAIILVVLVTLAGGGFVLLRNGNDYPKTTSSNQQQTDHQQTPSNSRVFFEKDRVSFEQYWPRDFYAPHMKADETEIQIYNEGSKTIEFKSIKVEYFVDGQKLGEKSGTWEKFPSRTSWQKTQYVNISPAYYRGEPLILNPGEKGKIHHHIEASSPIGEASRDIPSAKDQKIKINLVYTIGGEEATLEKELIRTTPPADGAGPQEDH